MLQNQMNLKKDIFKLKIYAFIFARGAQKVFQKRMLKC